MKGIIFCISGPSGVGKGTIVKELMTADPELALSVSCTTRAPRPGEQHGVHYFFITHEEFRNKLSRGEFLEYDEHFGNYYGTLKDYVTALADQDKLVILEIDVVGAFKAKEYYGSTRRVVNIFIKPPSLEALEERLHRRGSESEEQLAQRRERVKFEYGQADKFDYIVLNDEVSRATAEILGIIQKEKKQAER